MDLNRFTEKAREAVASAKQLAVQYGQQQIDVEYVLLARLEQQDGLASKVLEKAVRSVGSSQGTLAPSSRKTAARQRRFGRCALCNAALRTFNAVRGRRGQTLAG